MINNITDLFVDGFIKNIYIFIIINKIKINNFKIKININNFK